MKSAVIYYSRSGATKRIAEMLRDELGADMIYVEPEKAYGGYLSAVLRNGREKVTKSTARVKTPVSDFAAYDVIFVGFPVWYGTMPDFMQEYLRRCGIAEKKVIPFVTAAAGGKEASLATVKKLFSDCEVTDYFFTTKPNNGDAEVWVKELGKKFS